LIFSKSPTLGTRAPLVLVPNPPFCDSRCRFCLGRGWAKKCPRLPGFAGAGRRPLQGRSRLSPGQAGAQHAVPLRTCVGYNVGMAASFGVDGMARWQMAVCLLLAALVIYNPFMSCPDTGSSLDFRHLPSNRATVGASELQHFTPKDGSSLLATTSLAIAHFLKYLVLPTTERPVPVELQVSFAPSQDLPASLWFRPPPAV